MARLIFSAVSRNERKGFGPLKQPINFSFQLTQWTRRAPTMEIASDHFASVISSLLLGLHPLGSCGTLRIGTLRPMVYLIVPVRLMGKIHVWLAPDHLISAAVPLTQIWNHTVPIVTHAQSINELCWSIMSRAFFTFLLIFFSSTFHSKSHVNSLTYFWAKSILFTIQIKIEIDLLVENAICGKVKFCFDQKGKW